MTCEFLFTLSGFHISGLIARGLKFCDEVEQKGRISKERVTQHQFSPCHWRYLHNLGMQLSCKGGKDAHTHTQAELEGEERVN